MAHHLTDCLEMCKAAGALCEWCHTHTTREPRYKPRHTHTPNMAAEDIVLHNSIHLWAIIYQLSYHSQDIS